MVEAGGGLLGLLVDGVQGGAVLVAGDRQDQFGVEGAFGVQDLLADLRPPGGQRDCGRQFRLFQGVFAGLLLLRFQRLDEGGQFGGVAELHPAEGLPLVVGFDCLHGEVDGLVGELAPLLLVNLELAHGGGLLGEVGQLVQGVLFGRADATFQLLVQCKGLRLDRLQRIGR